MKGSQLWTCLYPISQFAFMSKLSRVKKFTYSVSLSQNMKVSQLSTCFYLIYQFPFMSGFICTSHISQIKFPSNNYLEDDDKRIQSTPHQSTCFGFKHDGQRNMSYYCMYS